MSPPSTGSGNRDTATVEGFGFEWSVFDQSELPEAELRQHFEAYFRVFPWEKLPKGAVGFDLGCGSGRWAKLVAPRVGHLHCIDASARALDVARRALAQNQNVTMHCASVDAIPLEPGSMDFGYSLGVLHHVPETGEGIAACANLLKRGAPLLLYLYYAFDNRPGWYRRLWQASEVGRSVIARLPERARYVASQVLAAGVYWPLARGARVAEKLGIDPAPIPLSAYRDKAFYTMRTDALDRFGTRLEQRFTRDQIRQLMERAGLERVTFSEHVPYWCAVGFKA